MSKPPKVHTKPFGGGGNDYFVDADGASWSVARLIHLAEKEKLPVFKIPLAAFDMNEFIRRNEDMAQRISWFKAMEQADTSYPIILRCDGVVMDGRHRLAKRIYQNKRYIKAVKFTWWVPPCRPGE